MGWVDLHQSSDIAPSKESNQSKERNREKDRMRETMRWMAGPASSLDRGASRRPMIGNQIAAHPSYPCRCPHPHSLLHSSCAFFTPSFSPRPRDSCHSLDTEIVVVVVVDSSYISLYCYEHTHTDLVVLSTTLSSLRSFDLQPRLFSFYFYYPSINLSRYLSI